MAYAIPHRLLKPPQAPIPILLMQSWFAKYLSRRYAIAFCQKKLAFFSAADLPRILYSPYGSESILWETGYQDTTNVVYAE